MAINFPTSIDTLTNPTSTDVVTSPSHATQHANANDAIEALEAKVGVNSSAVTTSHDYKLSGVTGTDKAVSKTGAETLTNKTLTSPVINTPTGIVKGDVGLGNVDNTSDATKNAASVTLTNKTIALGSNTVSGTLAEFNTAVTDDNIMSLGGAETVTGVKTFNDSTLKLNGATSGASTLKAPAVASTYVHTLPAATDTLVGQATTDALTNKTLTDTTNNVAAKSLHSATTIVDVSAATAPSVGQILTATDSTHATWQNPASSGSTTTATAGVNIASGAAVFVADTSSRTIDIATTGTNTRTFGQTSAGIQKIAQSFNETTYVGKVSIWLKTVNSPTDDVRVSIQADSAGAPSGTIIYSGTIAATSLSGTFTQYTITLNGMQKTSGAGYWIVVDRTGAEDDTNYYQAYGAGADVYAGGTIAYMQTTWNNQAEDMRISILDNLVTGNVYETSAIVANYSDTFIGFANAAYTAGQTATINVAVATGLSGLTAGVKQYLADAWGTIASSAGTVTRKVGISISTTSITVNNIW